TGGYNGGNTRLCESSGPATAFDRRLALGAWSLRQAAQSDLGSTVLLGHALRQRVADVRFHQTNVRSVDRTIDGDIFAEVGGVDRRAGLPFDLRDVGSIHRSIPRGITNEHARAYRRIGQNRTEAIGHVTQSNRDLLYIGDAR